MNFYFDIIPLKRLGPFEFNKSINDYLHLPIYEVSEEYDEDASFQDWKVYSLVNRDIRIYIEDEKVISIACYDECIYNNFNLIGMNFKEFKGLIMLEPNQIDHMDLDDGIQDVYDFDSIALQVYVKKGKIVCITAGSLDEDAQGR